MKSQLKRVGTVLLALVGVAVIVALASRSATTGLAAAVLRVGQWFPLVLVLEAAIVALNAQALAWLYHSAGSPPLGAELWRVSLRAQLVAVVAPAGRLVAETIRAAAFAPIAGRARAAGAAAWMQALVLGGNAIIAVPIALATVQWCGMTWPTFAVVAYCAVSLVLGGAIAIFGRARLGAQLGKRLPLARDAGPAFDEAFRSFVPGPALVLEATARSLLVLQITVLLHALGAGANLARGFATAGVILAGAAAGDFVPAQMGATDGATTLSAHALHITASDALAITLGLHAAQLCVGLLGAFVVSWFFKTSKGAPELS